MPHLRWSQRSMLFNISSSEFQGRYSFWFISKKSGTKGAEKTYSLGRHPAGIPLITSVPFSFAFCPNKFDDSGHYRENNDRQDHQAEIFLYHREFAEEVAHEDEEKDPENSTDDIVRDEL